MGLSLWIARSDLIAARRVSIAFAAKGLDRAAINETYVYETRPTGPGSMVIDVTVQ